MAKMRPQVRKFAQRMEAKLAEHDEGRGSVEWHGEPSHVLFYRLVSEVAELARALPDGSGVFDREGLTEKSVRLGNVAMMIADVYGA